MYSIKKFIEGCIGETQDQISKEKLKSFGDKKNLKYLEGRLDAYKQMWKHIEKSSEKERLFSGSLSAFSPQG